jgi:hypothetical protein
MPLSWNEIKNRALAFSKEWAGESSEDAEAKSFWDGFFNIFGLSRKRVAAFEEPVKKLGAQQGFIDLFWKGVLLVEHKSRGKSLEKAYTQALDYFPGILERDLPKYVLVSDFARLRLYDLEENEQHEFALADLHKNVNLFGFIAGYQVHKIQEQNPVNIKAAERMGRLHDQMKAVGYDGHPLELYLVRILFCLFAEDTGIFERQQFQDYIEQRTGEDGSDLAHHLGTLFHVLNTPPGNRLTNLDEQLAAFPCVNGKLFAEMLPPAGFDCPMRQALLDCCALDWSRISPAIFGSLFQSIMDKQARRNLGAHYTSETNILKLIKPLFLDGLWEEFERIKNNRNRLFDFHKKLRQLTFFDPACGCGNFLVIAYRELRLLELAVLRASRDPRQQFFAISLIQLDVDQFYGIEIEEFPAQIAQVALWLMDHQMNQLVSAEFGIYFARIPLKSSANIVCANALRLDWNEVIPAERVSYILGNPPFVGAKFMSDEQRADVALVFDGMKNSGLLDLVTAWYVKAARMMRDTAIRCAFVSTNSICQGEQVGALWSWMLAQGMRIFFAHRTFQWNNEAKGKAAVHCVIVGFAAEEVQPKWLFEYEQIKGEPQRIQARNINPYLVDAADILINKRAEPISWVPIMKFGNQPIDGGGLILSPEERDALLSAEPEAGKFVRLFLGSVEFLNNIKRYCFWLKDANPTELKRHPRILERLQAVKDFRLASNREATRQLAETPSQFAFVSHENVEYIIVPSVSSERRQFVPLGFMPANVIASNLCLIIPRAGLCEFGILSSTMHNAWLRTVCGRLKSDYRYSAGIVYNNFPWPENPTDKHQQAIEAAAQGVLDARSQFPASSLADLYDSLTMPPVLLKAHQTLDRAVDAAYGRRDFKSEAERVAFLFERYQHCIDQLPAHRSNRGTR